MSDIKKSGVKNITWHKKRKKWQVVIKIRSKIYFGGYFWKLDEAIQALEDLKSVLIG